MRTSGSLGDRDAAIFITVLDRSGAGLGVAIKDCIAVAGVPSTAGCRAVAEHARPALADAACLHSLRAAVADKRAHIAGTTNLHELTFGVTGCNPWFGTPRNPLDPMLVPGGSSSGSAVAVAIGAADVAVGTDTGGSIRIPAACCGVAGLKTTAGRLPGAGVRPLAPTLDTVGPLARDAVGLVRAMDLLEPGFAAAVAAATVEIDGRTPVVGRFRPPADPAVDDACDAALAGAGMRIVDIVLPRWDAATAATRSVLMAEAWDANAELFRTAPGGIGADVADRLRRSAAVPATEVVGARAVGRAWAADLQDLFRTVDVLALPTLTSWPPPLDDADMLDGLRLTLPINLAGVPAVAVPVKARGRLPASLQLVGPAGSDAMLVALSLRVPAPGQS